MNDRRMFLVLFALLATAAAATFFSISIDRHIYAPGAGRVERRVGEQLYLLRFHLPARFVPDFSSVRLLRKAYSVIAFAIVGFFSAPLFARRSRLRNCALLVALFSTTIEIAQKLTGSAESLLSNAFDIGCGAVGGALGALLFNTVTALFERRRSGR